MIRLLAMLYFEFLKTGLFAVGGGMATVPFLMRMSVNHPDWFSAAELADMIAVSESTPGPIGVNMATYVGFKTCGVAGSLAATLGLATPCVIIILIIARVLKQFKDNRYVNYAFYGLRPCSVGLIAAAGALVVKICMFNTDLYSETGRLTDFINCKSILLAAVLVVLTRYVKQTKKLHPVVFIALSAVAGVVFSF